jgi:hypothetical protein
MRVNPQGRKWLNWIIKHAVGRRIQDGIANAEINDLAD